MSLGEHRFKPQNVLINAGFIVFALSLAFPIEKSLIPKPALSGQHSGAREDQTMISAI